MHAHTPITCHMNSLYFVVVVLLGGGGGGGIELVKATVCLMTADSHLPDLDQ